MSQPGAKPAQTQAPPTRGPPKPKVPESVLDFAVPRSEMPPSIKMEGGGTASQFPQIKEGAGFMLQGAYGRQSEVVDAYFLKFYDDSGNTGLFAAIETQSQEIASAAAANKLKAGCEKINASGYLIYRCSKTNEFYWSNRQFFLMVAPDMGEGYAKLSRSSAADLVRTVVRRTGGEKFQ